MLVCKESELQFQVKNIETSWVIDCNEPRHFCRYG